MKKYCYRLVCCRQVSAWLFNFLVYKVFDKIGQCEIWRENFFFSRYRFFFFYLLEIPIKF